MLVFKTFVIYLASESLYSIHTHHARKVKYVKCTCKSKVVILRRVNGQQTNHQSYLIFKDIVCLAINYYNKLVFNEFQETIKNFVIAVIRFTFITNLFKKCYSEFVIK